MITAIDVAGIWDALAQLPDRTPEQRRLDEVSADVQRAADDYLVRDDAEDEQERAADWAVERLREARLSKVARAAVATALGVDPEDLVA